MREFIEGALLMLGVIVMFAGILALQFAPLVGVVLLTLWAVGVWP